MDIVQKEGVRVKRPAGSPPTRYTGLIVCSKCGVKWLGSVPICPKCRGYQKATLKPKMHELPQSTDDDSTDSHPLSLEEIDDECSR